MAGLMFKTVVKNVISNFSAVLWPISEHEIILLTFCRMAGLTFKTVVRNVRSNFSAVLWPISEHEIILKQEIFDEF